jgi:Gly-Xaa carboxypeptidase
MLFNKYTSFFLLPQYTSCSFLNTRHALTQSTRHSFSNLNTRNLLPKYTRCSKHILFFIKRYSLLYIWKGQNTTLPSLFLASHIDVVPVPDETLTQWTHPPFAGFSDGKTVWGRGASDTKSTLVAVLEAVERLLEEGFVGERNVILAFVRPRLFFFMIRFCVVRVLISFFFLLWGKGHDEEVSGYQGAKYISRRVQELGYTIGMIIDEGVSKENLGAGEEGLVLVGTAEKGYMDMEVVVNMPGGHSSIPPDHTGAFIFLVFAVKILTWRLCNMRHD